MSSDPRPSSKQVDLYARFVDVLSRAIRTGALYGYGHPRRTALMQQVCEHVALAAGGQEWLLLRPHPNGLELHGELLKTDEALDIARRLSAGGLSVIEISRSLSPDEANRLLGMLVLDFEHLRLDADLTTMLWEHQWNYVRWEGVQVPTKPLQEEPSTFNSALPSDALPEPLSANDWSPRDFAPSQREIEFLASELAAASAAPTPVQVASTLCQLVGLENEREHFSTALELVRAVVDQCFRSGQFSGANDTIDLLRQFRQDCHSLTEEKVRAIDTCQEQVADPASIKTAIATIETGKWDDRATAVRVLSNLGVGAAPTLFRAFLAMAPGGGRDIVKESLVNLLRENLSSVTERFAELQGADFHETIHLLRQVGTKEVVPLLNQALHHAPLEARLEIVDALRVVGGAHARTVVARTLSDPVGDVRCRAAAALPSLGAREALEPLLREMLRAEFRERPIEEKRVFFHALGSTNVPEVLPFLRKLLSQKALLRRKHVEEDRLCAATALGAMTHPDAEPLKNEIRSNGSRAMHDALDEGARHRGTP
jgi:HEAT repeat protein